MPKQAADKPKKGADIDAIIASVEQIKSVKNIIKGILKKGNYEKKEMISF